MNNITPRLITLKGSATALGADAKDLVGKKCEVTGHWEGIAEHVGHTKESIKEYCSNWVPGAMDALKVHSPSSIIAQVKEGKFGMLFPDLAHLEFLVTGKPEYGTCLFFADDTFGAAVCSCDKKECNDLEALKFIVDKDLGPMRLIQFIDGSLAQDAALINAIVPGLMSTDGKFKPAKAADVTAAHVDEILKIDGMSTRTTKDELLAVITDYQDLMKAMEQAREVQKQSGIEPPKSLAKPAEAETLIMTVKIDAVDYTQMTDTQKIALKNNLKDEFAMSLNVQKDQVEVKLSAGSVNVEVKVIAKEGQKFEALMAPDADKLVAAVKAVPEIEKVTTGTITASPVKAVVFEKGATDGNEQTVDQGEVIPDHGFKAKSLSAAVVVITLGGSMLFA